MKDVLREDESGVSEVIGTILILAITVILFSTIIIFVTGIPTPATQTRLDVQSAMDLIYNGAGNEVGVNITLQHQGGEALQTIPTIIYVTSQRGTNPAKTDIIKLHKFNPLLAAPNGLLDGSDSVWNVGERWAYRNMTLLSTDKITVTVVDSVKSVVLWSSPVNASAGTRPPYFADKWSDSLWNTVTADPVESGLGYFLFTRVADPDGDLNNNSVYVIITAWFNTGDPCAAPQQMKDDGIFPDRIARDGVFSLGSTSCTSPPNPSITWDGSLLLVNATDKKGHAAQSRYTLVVVPPGSGGAGTGPLSLTKFNDLQGYDIFNKTEWDANRWTAKPTRTFRQGESVVIVVASQFLVELGLSNDFLVYDGTSGTQQLLVFGGGAIGSTTHPSNSAAFTFDGAEANYNIFTYTFKTKSVDYQIPGSQMVPGRYQISIDLKSSKVLPPRNRFAVSDSITITTSSGSAPAFPTILTYKDAAMTKPSNLFSFTQTMYVKLVVGSTDASFSVGTVLVQDFIGGVEVFGAPGVTPVSVATINSTTTYKFSIDLSRANRDPWLFGNNSYTLSTLSIRDANENYDALSTQVYVLGPRWNLDIGVGSCGPQDRIGRKNYGDTVFGTFYAQAQAWDPTFVDSFPGNFRGCQAKKDAPTNPITAMAFADLDGDSDLDIAAAQDENTGVLGKNKVLGIVEWFRNTNGLGYSSGATPWQKSNPIDTLCAGGVAPPCITALAVGHINRDSLLDIAIGTTTGQIWWYANDGTWRGRLVASVGVRVNDMKLADLNGDHIADLVVGLDTNTNSLRVYINDGTGAFGTTTETITSGCCYVNADSAGIGPVGSDPTGLPSPYYQYTRQSNDQRETVAEVLANYTAVTSETNSSTESVSGSWTNLTDLDGVSETLTEGVSGSSYTLGTPNGHRWHFGNVRAQTSDKIEVHIHAGIQSPGTEPFNLRWSTSSTGPWSLLGSIDSQTFGEYIFQFSPTSNINGATLYLSLLDSDQSTGPSDRNTDSIVTAVTIDYLYLVITRNTGTTSATSRIWTTVVITAGQDAYKFFVEGLHTVNGENDAFHFRYATAIKGPFVDLLTLRSPGTDTTYSVAMDNSVGGKTLYILVEDTDRTTNNPVLDTMNIDWMYVNGYKVNSVAYFPSNPGVATNSIAIADIDKDNRADIVAGLNTSKVHVYWNSGTGTAYAGPDVLNTPATVNAVDVGYISGNVGALSPDTRLDIAVVMNNNNVYGFYWNGVRNSWSTNVLFLIPSGTGIHMRVGDIDGDLWDDIVVTTSVFSIFYYRNNNRVGTGFAQNLIDTLSGAKAIYTLDLGDVARGFMATYAEF